MGEVTVGAFLWGDWPHAEDYLRRLFKSIQEHADCRNIRFVCFTDMHNRSRVQRQIDPNVEPLAMDTALYNNLKKSYMFRPGNGIDDGQVFIFDLDVVIVGSIDEMLGYRGRFATCKGAFFPRRIGGSVISFNAGDEVFRRFMWGNLDTHDGRHGMATVTGGFERQFFNCRVKDRPEYRPQFWEDLYPEQIVSFKKTCRTPGYVPDSANIVRFHGKPRPHQIDLPWMRDWYAL